MNLYNKEQTEISDELIEFLKHDKNKCEQICNDENVLFVLKHIYYYSPKGSYVQSNNFNENSIFNSLQNQDFVLKCFMIMLEKYCKIKNCGDDFKLKYKPRKDEGGITEQLLNFNFSENKIAVAIQDGKNYIEEIYYKLRNSLAHGTFKINKNEALFIGQNSGPGQIKAINFFLYTKNVKELIKGIQIIDSHLNDNVYDFVKYVICDCKHIDEIKFNNMNEIGKELVYINTTFEFDDKKQKKEPKDTECKQEVDLMKEIKRTINLKDYKDKKIDYIIFDNEKYGAKFAKLKEQYPNINLFTAKNIDEFLKREN